MKKLPLAMELVLCERLEVDSIRAQYSLANVFIWLPWTEPGPSMKSFTIYGTLFDGSGEGPLELVVSQLERERTIHKLSKWYASPGRGMSHLLELKVKNCHFPVPGRYTINIQIDKEVVAQFYLDVLRR